jgi:ferredoxin
MRIRVDLTLCESNGLCMQAAPAVFLLDDDDELVLLQDEVGDDQRQAVLEAVARCPKQAIKAADD